MNLTDIQKSIKELESNTSSLKGKVALLEEQYDANLDRLVELQDLADTNVKAIELLNHVQKATKEKIKEVFENVVTKALQFIHQSNDYRFELEFGRRGNIPELNFNVITPDLKEPHDIMDTRGGGTADIVSLALRFVILEISKTPGFLFFDEPEKHLDSPETLYKMIEFIKETQKNSDRQLFIITHKDEMVESVPDPIIIKSKGRKCPADSGQKEEADIKPKKRGRPKKEK